MKLLGERKIMKSFIKIFIVVLFATFLSFSESVEELDYKIIADSDKYYAVYLESKVVDLATVLNLIQQAEFRYCVEFVSMFNANVYIFRKLECED